MNQHPLAFWSLSVAELPQVFVVQRRQDHVADQPPGQPGPFPVSEENAVPRRVGHRTGELEWQLVRHGQ